MAIAVEVWAAILGSLDCYEKRITRKSRMNRRYARLTYEKSSGGG